MRKRSWTNPRTEHERRQALNAALPANSQVREFVAPDDDKDLQQRFPFGKYEGRTLAEILEADPGYLNWMDRNVDLREGPFAAAFAAVVERYQERIASSSAFRRAERF